MTFQLSPGVVTTEQDLTSVTPSVSTTVGAIAGVFDWGPVRSPYRVSNESELANVFGKPSDKNANWFFSAANFLSYASNLIVNRVEVSTARNASCAEKVLKTGTITLVGGEDGVVGDSTLFESEIFVGDKIVVSSGGFTYEMYVKSIESDVSLTLEENSPTSGSDLSFEVVRRVVVNSEEHYETLSSTEKEFAGVWAARFPGDRGNSIGVSIADSESFDTWAYKNEFTSAPSTSPYAFGINPNAKDELHIVVVDVDGKITGTANAVIEKFPFVSKAANSTTFGKGSNYYANVVNRNSKYVWFMSHPVSGLSLTGLDFGSAVSATEQFKTIPVAISKILSNGDNGKDATAGEIISAYEEYENTDLYDFSLLIAGPSNAVIVEELVALAEARQDFIVFISPTSGDGGPIIGSGSNKVDEIIEYRNITLNVNSTYAFMDTGWKYQYDKYNDVYRWVPLNGDIAGITSRSDETSDAWKSPAGFNRGQLKNVVKLAVNPNKAQRDVLYSAGINPVVSFPGQGTVLYGDKTLTSRPSAFDRINVRRLFIILRKAIARASQYQLFEFNNVTTRASFRAYVEPFLRTIQARDGITAFRVVCDESNNTADVILRNEFVGDIIVQPAYSINFIRLNFSAVRSDVSFSEIVG